MFATVERAVNFLLGHKNKNKCRQKLKQVIIINCVCLSILSILTIMTEIEIVLNSTLI